MSKGPIGRIVARVRNRAPRKRRAIFLDSFSLSGQTAILDLGSEDGSRLYSVIKDTAIIPHNVTIADIAEGPLLAGRTRFGFATCTPPESGRLPFEDNAFDIVFSNSAIEHVTLPKDEVWSVTSSRAFPERAQERQREFASEIRRVGRDYYVQTPNRRFVIESHTWLPAVGWLPRPILLPTLKITNRLWIKKTIPDWALLSKDDMRELFPEAKIVSENMAFMAKSIIAIKTAGKRVV